MPEDLKKAGLEDLLEKGGELMDEMEVKVFSDGTMSEISSEKRERLLKLFDTAKANKKNPDFASIDEWDDDGDNKNPQDPNDSDEVGEVVISKEQSVLSSKTKKI